jgi:Predicted restriction endonuclease
MIDKDKVVFITVDWMKSYKGITETDKPLGTGGSYPKEQKHEVFNFLDDGGICYGYTPPYGKINLKAICPTEIKKTARGKDYIDNVLVIFNASKDDGKKRRIVGFYVGATIYKEAYDNTNSKRKINSNNSFASYNIIVNSEDAYLFEDLDERKIFLPYSKKDEYGYGQSNIWYANSDNRCLKFRNDIITQIKDIIKENAYDFENDEQKYFEGERKTKIKEINILRRNALARKKCLDYYFPNNKNYKCILCDFNFEMNYGSLGEKFIEVHHIESHTKQSKIKGKHEIDPITDLIPVCSNCHSMIHRKKPAISIEKMKEIRKENKTNPA